MMHLKTLLAVATVLAALIICTHTQSTTTNPITPRTSQEVVTWEEKLKSVSAKCRAAVLGKCKRDGKTHCQSLALRAGKACAHFDEYDCTQAEYYGLRVEACKAQCTCDNKKEIEELENKISALPCGDKIKQIRGGFKNYCNAFATDSSKAQLTPACSDKEYFDIRNQACNVYCSCNGVDGLVSSVLALGVCFLAHFVGKKF